MNKLHLCTFLAAMSLFGTVASGAAVPAAADDVHPDYGYHEIDFEVDMPESVLEGTGEFFSTSDFLPQSYSSVSDGRFGPARSQSPDSTCWAFAATAACEAGLNLATGEVTALSDLQLVNFFYNEKYDPLGNADGDRTANLTSNKLMQGGNHAFTMWGLANWTNGAPESVLPYTTANRGAARSSTISADYANDYDIAHLQNAYILPYGTDSASMNGIKAAILDYGSVACAYNHSDAYYNSAAGAYCSDLTSVNHSVTIVGWNDAYPAANYRNGETRNGAWLVRNSWGDSWGTDGDADPADSGAEGYFWLSYYDTSLASSNQVYVFDFHPVEQYRYNYQYDGSCGAKKTAVSAGDRVCAVYEIAGLTSDAERIDAVGIGVYSTDMSGTVYLYVDPDENDPVSGTLAAAVPFSTAYAGFYTVDIPNGPVLQAGETFSVVASFDQSGYVFSDTTYNNGTWIGFTASTAGDRTYIVSPSGAVTDLARQNYTARLKAYTNDAEAVVRCTVSYNACGGTNAPAAQTVTAGQSLILSRNVPSRSGYTFLGWSEEAGAEEADYQPGDSFRPDGSTVLYAVWEKLPSEVHVNASVTCTETGKNKKKVVTYTANITASASGTGVASVAYSLDEGASWRSGTSFTSSENILSFLIRVTDTDGGVHAFRYSSGSVSPIELITEAQELTISAETLVLEAGESARITVEHTPSYVECDLTADYDGDVIALTVSGGVFTVRALSEGETDLIITDEISGLSVTCSVTVLPEPEIEKEFSVSVRVTSQKTGKGNNKVTTYTAAITVSASGTTVQRVEYSPTGSSWTTGTSYSSTSQIGTFYIRVTDADDETHLFRYSGGSVSPYEMPSRMDAEEGPEKEITVSVDLSSETTGKGKNKVTVYTAQIEAEAVGTEIAAVEYSADGENWTESDSFTSSEQIKSFFIRVTDTDGEATVFYSKNGSVTTL